MVGVAPKNKKIKIQSQDSILYLILFNIIEKHPRSKDKDIKYHLKILGI
jgi:hypothetical protein